MNNDCEKIKDQIADLVTGILPSTEMQKLHQHLDDCPSCRDYLHALKNEEMLLTQLFTEMDTDMIKSQERVLQTIDRSHTIRSIKTLPIRNITMKNPLTKLAAAAAIIITTIMLSTTFFHKSTSTAYAAQVLQEAIDAVSDVWSVHMKARMRTLPSDNFSNIGLDYDFVDIEMWKRTNAGGQEQWRVEKPGRVLLMDGQSTIMLIKPNYGVLNEKALPVGCYDSWSGRFLNVHDLLDNELQNAKNSPHCEVRIGHQKIEGRDKLVLEVEVTTDVAEDDYLRNQFISDSNHVKVYQFDAQTNLLDGLQVFVHTADEDVLIFEVTDIEYNMDIDDGVFALDLPEDMIWHIEPEILPDNERYEKMTPKEAAEAFFQACADENWEEVLKFWTASRVDDQMKTDLGGLEIVSLGEPFQSAGYDPSGWFVPYEIRLKSGEVKKYNLAIRKDNPAKRFVVNGGI